MLSLAQHTVLLYFLHNTIFEAKIQEDYNACLEYEFDWKITLCDVVGEDFSILFDGETWWIIQLQYIWKRGNKYLFERSGHVEESDGDSMLIVNDFSQS